MRGGGLSKARHGTERILARSTVQAMTTDQLTPAPKAASPFLPGFRDSRGWGFGVAMVTRRDDVAGCPAAPAGMAASAWWSDPQEELVGVLMVQRLYDPTAAAINAAFWTLAYQAIDD
jgi:CubicO group peptidase (beta-lactamase class C family)